MLVLEEFYNLLKAHFDFYYSYETPQDLTITLSYEQVLKLKCDLSGIVGNKELTTEELIEMGKKENGFIINDSLNKKGSDEE